MSIATEGQEFGKGQVMRSAVKLLRDFNGIISKLGLRTAVCWLVGIILKLPDIVKSGNLQEADRQMGEGPFRVAYSPTVSFNIVGTNVFSGIREMYVRDTYMHNQLLKIDDGDVVVDLGANIGNFTNLALAHGLNVRVIAVEPNTELNKAWRYSLSLNDGFLERARLISAFIGSNGVLQEQLLQDARYSSASWLSEDEFLSIADLRKIDFLKCDIEGSEFGLLKPGGKLFNMVRKLAVEIHAFAGDVKGFESMLCSEGFTIRHVQRDPDGTVTVLAERMGF